MAKKGGGCSPRTIRFKTKRGKVIQFTGRPGGQKQHGGDCSNKHRSTRHLAVYKSALRKAAKACKGKKGKMNFRSCVRSKFKAAL